MPRYANVSSDSNLLRSYVIEGTNNQGDAEEGRDDSADGEGAQNPVDELRNFGDNQSLIRQLVDRMYCLTWLTF